MEKIILEIIQDNEHLFTKEEIIFIHKKISFIKKIYMLALINVKEIIEISWGNFPKYFPN